MADVQHFEWTCQLSNHNPNVKSGAIMTALVFASQVTALLKRSM